MRRVKFIEIQLVLALALGASFVTVLSGCSNAPINENDPGSLYRDAEDDIKNDHYQIALDKLRVIRNKFPYSKYSVDAQLRIADVYFLQEDYAEAAPAYETFRDLHPKHEKTPYAMFRIGKSYFKDVPGTVARDMSPARKAAEAYQEFLARFPTAPEAQEARDDLSSSRKLLAEKELYIADFYYKRDFYGSAKPRYQHLIELYPETPAAAQAKEKIEKINEYEAKHPEAKKENG